jgi:hypothetical protein
MSGQRMMTALSRRIPITLLCDLADPVGPHSRAIYGMERAHERAYPYGLEDAGEEQAVAPAVSG